ncbi:MAG: hypothetical protein WC670_07960 [Pseudolabrys sp.]
MAHARLCRQIAASSADENVAAELFEMAEECDRAAAEDLALDRLGIGVAVPVVSKWNSV